MDIISPEKRKKLLRLALLVMAGGFLIYTCVGFLFFPLWGKDMVEKRLSRILHREVGIDAIYTNPFLFTMDIRELVIEKADKTSEPFISLDRVLVDLSPGMMFTPALLISRVEVLGPEIFITRNPDQSFNFSDLIFQDPKPKKKPHKKLFPLVVSDIRLDKGKVVFTDHAGKAVYQLGNIHFHFWDLSTLSVTDEQGKEKPSITMAGKADVKNISLDHKELGNLVKIAGMFLSLDNSDLLNLSIAVTELGIISPEMHVLRDQDRQFPLVSVFAPSMGNEVNDPEALGQRSSEEEQENTQQDQGEKSDTGHGISAFSLKLQKFTISDGRLSFVDASRDFSAGISPFQFQVTDCIFKKNKKKESAFASFSMDMRSENKEHLVTSGTFSWAGKDSFPIVDARIKAWDIKAERYSPYYGDYLPYLIEKAEMDLSATISLGQQASGHGSGERAEASTDERDSSLDLSILEGSLAIENLHVRQKTEPGNSILEIPELHIGETKMFLGDKTLLLGPMETREGKIFFSRHADGTTSFSLPPSFLKQDSGQKDTDLEDSPQKKWQVSLASLDLEDYAVQFTDTATLEPVALTLGQVNISTGKVNLTDKGKSDVALDLMWNQKGAISLKGDLGLHPLNANLDVSLEEFPLPSLSPYLEEYLRVQITEGRLFTRGKVAMEMDSSHSMGLSCQGHLSIKDFTSIDKILSKKIITWKHLDVSGIHLDTFPVSLAIEEVALDDFFSQTAISKQGRSNFGELLVPKEKKGPSSDVKKLEKGTPAQVEIGKVQLKKGQVAFFDESVSPHFQIGITDLEGSIKDISSRKDGLAKIDIKAMNEKSSPITFAGSLNPFPQNLFVDIRGSLTDVEMARLTPYSSKYLGRTIAKGKLGVDLEYNIKGTSLKSRNLLSMDRLTLGKSVQSKDAVSLPLDLAITLLRNKKGLIDLDLPVSGDLADPTFQMGSVIFTVIRNIIIKTVSAPFSILGAMMGSGEELGYVVFSPGSEIISESEKKKLGILAKALKEKPALGLEIKGSWDPGLDSHALKKIWFENHLKSMKLQGERDSGAVSLSQVILSSQERSRYIEKAWKKKIFEIPVQEDALDEVQKEDMMVTHAPITDSELRNLAMERGTQIKEYLLSLDMIGEERLFLLEPGLSEKTQEKEVRVDFSIR